VTLLIKTGFVQSETVWTSVWENYQ